MRVERLLPTLLADSAGSQLITGLTSRLLKNLVPYGLKPIGAAELPELERSWELRVRLFVDVLDEKNRVQGRVVLGDYDTDQGSMGNPADSKGVITIGAVDSQGRPMAAGALGPPAFQELAGTNPDIWAYADMRLLPDGQGSAHATDLAASYAAGWTACVMSACPSGAEGAGDAAKTDGKNPGIAPSLNAIPRPGAWRPFDEPMEVFQHLAMEGSFILHAKRFP